jgi:hypothetical protein
MRIRRSSDNNAGGHEGFASYEPCPAVSSMKGHAVHHGGADSDFFCG